MKAKNIKELPITGIMVPDTKKKQPCKHPCVLVKHVPYDNIVSLIKDRIKGLEKETKGKAWYGDGYSVTRKLGAIQELKRLLG